MEVTVRADEGNWARYNADDGAEPIKGSEILLPRRFIASFPDDRGGPELLMAFEIRSGVPQCREVLLRSGEDGREVRPADVRAVDVERFCEIACQLVALHVTEQIADGGGAVAVTSHRNADLANVAKTLSKARRNTRRQLADDRLHEVAEVYRANPMRPTKAVKEHFGLADRTASLYVRRARDAGLLQEGA